MSNWTLAFICFLFLCLGIGGLANALRQDALESRIQALEQSQCAEKQHAAYRFKLCQDQLRGRE